MPFARPFLLGVGVCSVRWFEPVVLPQAHFVPLGWGYSVCFLRGLLATFD